MQEPIDKSGSFSYNKDNLKEMIKMKVVITDHADDRRKRLGRSKKAMERQAELALERGVPHSKTKGKLKKWIDSEAIHSNHQKMNEYIIFNNHLFLFRHNEDERILVTMSKVPTKYAKNINNYIK